MAHFSRYERQFILKEIGREGQERLGRARVAVVGLGALGSVTANLLARAGIGTLLVIDRDYLEINNLQRQILYDEDDLGQNLPKAVAAKSKLKKVNSEIRIEAEVADLNALTIDSLLGNIDLIVDGTDNFETRFLINDFSLDRGVPWIYGGAVRTEGMSYVILPGKGPCLRCLFGEAPRPQEIQTCDQVGILAPVAHVISSFQVIEAIKILAGKEEAVDRRLWKMDLWSRELKAISVAHLASSPCPGCRDREFPYLSGTMAGKAVTLCGRNAVQIAGGREEIDFKTLAERWDGKAEIKFNRYLFKLQAESCEITVFHNGRAIVRGTEDAGRAKSLYAKYIGN